jgi:hypothetical protein
MLDIAHCSIFIVQVVLEVGSTSVFRSWIVIILTVIFIIFICGISCSGWSLTQNHLNTRTSVYSDTNDTDCRNKTVIKFLREYLLYFLDLKMHFFSHFKISEIRVHLIIDNV